MASRRLTKYDRNAIVTAVVEQVFNPKRAALTKRENDLAIEVLNSQVSPAQRAVMAQLPGKFFTKPDYSHYLRAAQPDTNNVIMVHLAMGTPVPSFLKSATVLIEDADLWNALASYETDANEIQTEQNAFRQKTRAVVGTFTTFKMALDTWPTLRELMGEDFFSEEPVANLPAPLVNELDTALIAAMAPSPSDVALAA